MKTLEEIEEILKEHKEEVSRKYKVSEIGIFGSLIKPSIENVLNDLKGSEKTEQ
jgi:predicted nucleotidyltransferase